MSLQRSLIQGKNMISSPQCQGSMKTRITQSLEYIERTLKLLEVEKSKVFLYNLSQHPFVKE